MKRFRLTRSIIAIIILTFLVTGIALAGVLDYEINWWDVSGGGGLSSGGQYSLNGTIGQADAGEMQGGAYSISGGFWTGGVESGREIFLPIIIR